MISVLMSVYCKEAPAWFARALRSITLEQTRPPEELVLVADGPLTEELEEEIRKLREILRKQEGSPAEQRTQGIHFRVIRLPENRQLGRALQTGLKYCRGELIARMDTDDIARPERLEHQEKFMNTHPEVAACGGEIAEFETEGEILRVKHMPETPEALYQYGKYRNPLNHMTVMFRKAAVEQVGGYRHFPLLEDYHLWSRMLAAGMKFSNLSEVLVEARIGSGFAKKRGGREYFRRYKKLRSLQLKWGYLTPPEYATSLTVTYAMTMQPGWVRGKAYQVLRKDLSKWKSPGASCILKNGLFHNRTEKRKRVENGTV